MDAPAPIEYLAITGLFKAQAREEGGRRILYMEASNEQTDLQGERVLAKSLLDSKDHFLKYGNIDLDHRTLLPSRGLGDNPYLWEIGHPIEVQSNGDRTLVKAELYQGDGEMARNANMVWDSLTKTVPPARWYPSVGGAVLERANEIDPLTKSAVKLIKRVRWTNIGLSRTPVNGAVPPVSVVEASIFAKCLTAEGCLNLTKALEAGAATQLGDIAGGQALSGQSLDRAVQATLPVGYTDVREWLAQWIRGRPGGAITPARLAEVAENEFGLSGEMAAMWAQRFLRDVNFFRRQ